MDNAAQAQFEITQVCEIGRRGVVLAGQIRSGVVRPGMQVHLPLNTGLNIVMTVKSVEFIDYPGGKADVGLILDEEDPDRRSLLVQLCEAGEVVSIRNAA